MGRLAAGHGVPFPFLPSMHLGLPPLHQHAPHKLPLPLPLPSLSPHGRHTSRLLPTIGGAPHGRRSLLVSPSSRPHEEELAHVWEMLLGEKVVRERDGVVQTGDVMSPVAGHKEGLAWFDHYTDPHVMIVIRKSGPVLRRGTRARKGLTARQRQIITAGGTVRIIVWARRSLSLERSGR